MLIQSIVSGVLVGGVLGAAAIGLSMIFGVMKIINFAQADFLMISMYITYFLSIFWGVNPLISALLVIPLFFLAGFALQKWVISLVVDKPMITHLLYTVGLQIVLQNVALVLYGSSARTLFTSIGERAVFIGDISLNQAQLIGFACSSALIIILHRFLTKTELGCILRATIDDKELAALLGINEKRIYMIAFGTGLATAGLAGVFFAIYYPVQPTVGTMFIVFMFTAVVLGGVGNIIGAFIGGVIIGIIQSLTTILASNQFQNLAVFIIFVLILLSRPKGLLGK